MRQILFILMLIGCRAVSAEELNDKVARNAINCFVGHNLAGSYEPITGNRYLAASFILLGEEATWGLVNETKLAATTEKEMFGLTDNEVGVGLVYDFCPKIHELTKKGTAFGNRIDDFAESYSAQDGSQ